MKLPMNVWRKISTRLFIPTIALLFFIIISLTRLRLEDTIRFHEHTSLRPSDDVVGETPRRNLLHADTSKVKLEPISDIMSKDALPESRDRRQLLLQQFQLHDGRGNSNTDAAHPSEPYFVMTDEITGENLLTLKDGHDDHPLNRLADLRSPRNKEKETIFFFHVPKVGNTSSHYFQVFSFISAFLKISNNIARNFFLSIHF